VICLSGKINPVISAKRNVMLRNNFSRHPEVRALLASFEGRPHAQS
jgi:hypothetical protein